VLSEFAPVLLTYEVRLTKQHGCETGALFFVHPDFLHRKSQVFLPEVESRSCNSSLRADQKALMCFFPSWEREASSAAAALPSPSGFPAVVPDARHDTSGARSPSSFGAAGYPPGDLSASDRSIRRFGHSLIFSLCPKNERFPLFVPIVMSAESLRHLRVRRSPGGARASTAGLCGRVSLGHSPCERGWRNAGETRKRHPSV
jgi:hypothetical protein